MKCLFFEALFHFAKNNHQRLLPMKFKPIIFEEGGRVFPSTLKKSPHRATFGRSESADEGEILDRERLSYIQVSLDTRRLLSICARRQVPPAGTAYSAQRTAYSISYIVQRTAYSIQDAAAAPALAGAPAAGRAAPQRGYKALPRVLQREIRDPVLHRVSTHSLPSLPSPPSELVTHSAISSFPCSLSLPLFPSLSSPPSLYTHQ
jgi:hypothetical protein